MEGVEILTGNNYGIWRDDMKVLLMEKNGWEITKGLEIQPAPAIQESATPTSDQLKETRDRVKEIKDFKIRKERAYSTIYLHLPREFRSLISNTEDPTTAWKILEKHFRPESRARAVGLTDDFFNCRISPDEEIGLYAARLQSIAEELNSISKPIPEFFLSFQLIRFLSSEYNSVVQTIYRWSDEDFNFQKILKELLEEESRLKQCRKDQDSIAFHVSTQRRRSKEGRSEKNVKFSPERPTSEHRGRNSRDRKRQNPPRRRTTPGGATTPVHRSVTPTGRPASSSRQRSRRPPETSFIVQALFSNQQAVANPSSATTTWIFDTAASSHFCCERALLDDYQEITDTTLNVAIAGVACPVEGKGTVRLEFNNGGESEIVILNNVLFSSKLRQNLISGPVIDKAGGSFKSERGKIFVFNKEGRKLFYAYKYNDLFHVKPKYCKEISVNSVVQNFKVTEEISKSLNQPPSDLSVWHRNFCHINVKSIKETFKNNAVRDLPDLKNQSINCEPCKLSKTKRKSFKPLNKIRSTKPLMLLHMDVCGPLPNVAIGGYRYFLTITDDFSRKTTVFPMKKKSEVFSCFLSFQKRAERFLNSKIIAIRTDNGMEFCSNEFEERLDDQGIKVERTNDYTPEQNGVAERFNLTALDAVKAILKDSGLGNQFWVEALFCFVYVWNRVCHSKQKSTPFELYGGQKPSVKHLKPFGTPVYLGIPKQLRRKLDMRAKKGILVGYAQRTRGYRIWLPEERKIVESINVTFDKPLNSGACNGSVLDPCLRSNISHDTDSDSSSDSETESMVEPAHSEISHPSSPVPGPSGHLPFVPIKNLSWSREAVPRKGGSRNDIYYRVEGFKDRLRSYKEVEDFCKANNISYSRDFFDFGVKNNFSGKVNDPQVSSVST